MEQKKAENSSCQVDRIKPTTVLCRTGYLEAILHLDDALSFRVRIAAGVPLISRPALVKRLKEKRRLAYEAGDVRLRPIQLRGNCIYVCMYVSKDCEFCAIFNVTVANISRNARRTGTGTEPGLDFKASRTTRNLRTIGWGTRQRAIPESFTSLRCPFRWR